ncbi:MAG TPA: TetR/AcrR family transcriptional regulator [Verrucomicrobiae bacterium]|nr:TetR/AcrR family transcriptional regulator [Verrucomicrobiae bacterium]
MGHSLNHSESATRRQLLQAALKSFADRGYAATSVRQIVDAARVSKPALYYYFKDKAGLFAALVDQAHDERYRLVQEAAERGGTLAEKLEEIAAAIFEFSVKNHELMRLAFASAFAASGEAPGQGKCREKGKRTFEFFQSLIEAGQASGELDRRFSVQELAMGIYGQFNSHVMVRLLVPECPLDRQTARQIVRLFLEGAAGNRGRGENARTRPAAPGNN